MRTRHSAEYVHAHYWIRTRREKPTLCEHCGQEKRLDWANKSHDYKLDVNDWMGLCRSCHMRYDAPYNIPLVMVDAIQSLRSVGMRVQEVVRVLGVSKTTIHKYTGSNK